MPNSARSRRPRGQLSFNAWPLNFILFCLTAWGVVGAIAVAVLH